MSFATRIYAGFAFALLLLIVIGTVSYRNTRSLLEDAAWVDHTHEVIECLADVLSSEQDVQRGQRGYLLTGEDRYLDTYRAGLVSLGVNLAEVRGLTEDNPTQQRYLDRLEPLTETHHAYHAETITMRSEGGFQTALEMVMTGRGKAIMDSIRQVIAEMDGVERELLVERSEQSESSAKQTTNAVVFGSIVATILLALVAFLITRPLTTTIRDVTGHLAAASTEILAAATQQATSAQEQAVSVGETVTSVDEVTQTAAQVSDRAKSVAEESKRSSDVSDSGRAVVAQTISGMRAVQERSGVLAENIVSLAEQAQSIGEIIATVNDLADQTNLLALNAAIEASRAGEHGQGFSVVAAEVKALAEQSKKATGQVRQSLSQIQAATGQAVGEVEETTKVIDTVMAQAETANEAITSLAGTIAEAAHAAAQISASTNQQAIGMKQVNAAMQDLSQAATKGQAATDQTQRAAQQLSELGERLTALIAGSA